MTKFRRRFTNLNDQHSKFEQAWESYKYEIKSIADKLADARYDGVTTRVILWEYSMAKESSLFLLPAVFDHKSIEEILTVLSPPKIPIPLEPPQLKDDPTWYSTSVRQTFMEGDNRRRLQLGEDARKLRSAALLKQDEFVQVQAARTVEMAQLQAGYAIKVPLSLARLIEVSNCRHPLPDFLRLSFRVRIDETASVALIEFEFPDYTRVELAIDRRKNDSMKYASPPQKKKLVRMCLYSLVIRAGYLASRILDGSMYQTIAINVRQAWFDPATGAARDGIICTIQAGVPAFLGLSLDTLDPEVCFRHLKGIAIPSFDAISPVRPIFVLNKDDDRFVERKLIDSALEPEANLAAMPWEDFEHLVAQLFEWEFAKQGVEVKVTRASRDRGVDAILFDPDPLRGGKFVLQAKRYTRPVDVAAVRDLYGTVMNEGANRGILITTSSYGPDSYEFAKDKPISLVDGPNLLLMLQRHGKRCRIDLAEARERQEEDDA